MKGNAMGMPWTRQQYMVAVVLGTALTTLPTAQASAAEPGERALTDISRYCTACWRNARLTPDCWSDCTQEVFCRLMERVAPDMWSRIFKAEGEERREFLRAIDTVKKRSQRSRVWSARSSETLADRREQRARRLEEARETVREKAAELLSRRQQRIVQMSVEGWTVHEIADELELAAERVSDEKYKAIRKLRSHLAEHPEA